MQQQFFQSNSYAVGHTKSKVKTQRGDWICFLAESIPHRKSQK